MSVFVNIAGLLQNSTSKYPNNTALEDLAGSCTTYQELSHSAQNTAAILSKNGLGFGNRIGILSSKNTDMVKVIFGILMAEAAYVPLDSNAPVSRNALICRDCGLQALITTKDLFNSLIESGYKTPYKEVSINNSLSLFLFSEKKQRQDIPLAYILYTSGSTGVPKGVMHTHSSALAFINWGTKTFNLSSKDRLLSHAPFHFDLSVFDLFVSVAAGATLVLTDEKVASNPLMLSEALSRKKISIFYTTPSVLSYMEAFGKMYKYPYDSLRQVLFAGEVFPINNLKR